MTLDEYNKAADMARKACERHINRLARRYVLAQTNVRVGHVIEFCGTRIRVDEIRASRWNSLPPQAVASGLRLRKDLTPFKSGETATLFLNDHVKILATGAGHD